MVKDCTQELTHTARNVNGKIVKKDLKPGLVTLWQERQALLAQAGRTKL
jgi:hypothetical protein